MEGRCVENGWKGLLQGFWLVAYVCVTRVPAHAMVDDWLEAKKRSGCVW